MLSSGSSSTTSTNMSRWVDERQAQVRHGYHVHHGKQGRRVHAIVPTNLKTELCRNFEKGVCTYGERCAFAHGIEELKYRTLREMQNAGRIPDAVKYRCIPCLTWVATGSCPYSTRCVFIHDPRVQGRQEAWLYAGSHMSSAYHSSDSAFFFPDLLRDPDGLLPRDSSLYDLDPAMRNAQDRADRSVYNMWYSFLSVLANLEATKAQSLASPEFNFKLTKNTLSPSSISSSGSTASLSDRCSSFGSVSSTSPTTISRSSSNSSNSGSGRCGGGSGSGSFTSTTANGRALYGRQLHAAEQHQEPAHRLSCGGCPRLGSFVCLSRGVPAAPPTPISSGSLIEGFPTDAAAPEKKSPREHCVPAVSHRHSSPYYGGGGVPSSRFRDGGSRPEQRAAAVDRYHSASAPPRRAMDVARVCGYEARESPLTTARPVFAPATENRGRPHYHHHRHNVAHGRAAMAAPARPTAPHGPAFDVQLHELARQSYYPDPAPERRWGSRLHRPESVRMLALDLGDKGVPTSRPARIPFCLPG